MGTLDVQNSPKLNKNRSGEFGFGLKKPIGRGREGVSSGKRTVLTRGSMPENDPWAAVSCNKRKVPNLGETLRHTSSPIW